MTIALKEGFLTKNPRTFKILVMQLFHFYILIKI